ncbi:MAG: HlyD family efflux transporter periplasmic adaptor subunit [Gammaproteobacteria bacterium]
MSVALAQERARRRTVRMRDTSAQDTVVDDRPRRQRRLLWIGAAGAATLILGILAYPAFKAWSGAELSVPLERLRIASVERGKFVRDVAVRGTVVAAVSPTLFAPADGTVTFLNAAGDTVNLRDIVATVESPEVASRLRQEEATLQRTQNDLERQAIDKKKTEFKNQQDVEMARVEVAAAERELRRAELSWEHQVISAQDYDKAKDDLAKAKLEFEHAQQNAGLESESLEFELRTMALNRDRQQLLVKELERQVEALNIRSPVNGMIGSLASEQKAAVTKNTPLLTVVDLSQFEIEILVPENYADDLVLGMDAEINFGTDRYPGVITAVSPEVQNNQVIARVRFKGDLPPGLRQNQRVSARIILESKSDTLMVQRGPFLDSGNGRIAYVVNGDLAQKTSIRVGSTSIGQVEILDGLEAGQRIVISNLAQFESADNVYLSD